MIVLQYEHAMTLVNDVNQKRHDFNFLEPVY
jgi:hypothetical protein